MNLKRIFKIKSTVDKKQPQEYYCSNFECTNLIAELSEWYHLLSKYGKGKSKHYCLDCIMEGKVS
jgi:hypothetical protein